MLHWKKLQGRRSNLLGIFLISGDSWIWHRLVIDISCCSCASSAWLITYPIFYHSGESLLKCYLPGMSATHRHTIAASPDFLRLKLWADGINYPPFSAMLHWKKLQRQDKSYVNSLRKEIRKPFPHRILRRRTGIRSRGVISRVVLTIILYI